MGKKRIKVFGEEEAKKKKEATKDRKIVKTGKEHGRVTDMGQVALKEAEEIKKKEKELKKATEATAPKARKKLKPKKKRSRKYLQAKKQIDALKQYPLNEAIKLVKKTSISQFNGQIELHLNLREKGLKREVKLPYPVDQEKKKTLSSEKKFPLIHLVIGKINAQESALAANFQAIIEIIGPKNIKKAVLTSTMGPGVKVDLTSL